MYAYFSLLEVFFSKCIEKVQVQDSGRIDDEDPLSR